MLTSITNPKVKEWKKLHKRKYRDQLQKFIVEGIHLVEEALSSDWDVEEVIVREDYEEKLPQKVEVTEVSTQVFATVAGTETPQGIAAVVYIKQQDLTFKPLTLLVDAVQDPGNLGTLIRTADAAGYSQVIAGKGTVDVFNEKVIRSTQGSLFHIPVFQQDLESSIEGLKQSGVTVYASTLENSASYKDFNADGNAALIVGNEGNGIDPTLTGMADHRVHIPIYGKAESLNVAMAGGILMYYFRG
ncbi:RNA methyltransferase [Halobacillus salinarum]|uniref:RNA methyltransferase n=1 Tax=Halobacillus salinarum TaxID=2932257 RepID=A0ABY4EP12_9BACI|nr:RNA methyltransferase [Halobacillus salinarum]UOQ46195.1 RNA methyltransferase [Halobacillus salinarum]